VVGDGGGGRHVWSEALPSSSRDVGAGNSHSIKGSTSLVLKEIETSKRSDACLGWHLGLRCVPSGGTGT
jgi:hypothetical protein